MNTILVGMLAKQIMRHSELSPEAGKSKYRKLFIDTNEYTEIKADVDRLLVKCGFQQIISGRTEN